jgi:hypothetical protein
MLTSISCLSFIGRQTLRKIIDEREYEIRKKWFVCLHGTSYGWTLSLSRARAVLLHAVSFLDVTFAERMGIHAYNGSWRTEGIGVGNWAI